MSPRQSISQLLAVIVWLPLLFASCIDDNESNQTLALYQQSGDSICKAAADTLRASLLQAIAEKGLPGAVRFCNEKALAITSLYATEAVTISRVAEKYRNPINKPDSLDAAQWQRYASLKAKGDSLRSTVIETSDAVLYYKPIMLQPHCAACHGQAVSMPSDLIATIDSLYPNDLAKGFSPGDLRGMWKIRFRKP